MIFSLKIFFHKKGESMKENFDSKKRLIISIFLNLGITAGEGVSGIITGSLALLSDAAHNLSDVLSLILGYIGESYSGKRPTEKHTFGYKRLEVITSLINAVFLLIIGTYILFEAFRRLNSPSEIEPFWVIFVSLIALLGNVSSIFILNIKEKSLNLRTAILHLVLDSIASVGVLISGLLIYFYDLFIADVIISFMIAFFIYYSALDVLKEVYRILMQGIPSEIEFRDVKNYLEGFEEIESVHDLHIWSLSSTEKVISCHICVVSDEIRRDELINKIENALLDKFGFEHVTIQIEKNKVCKTGENLPGDL